MNVSNDVLGGESVWWRWRWRWCGLCRKEQEARTEPRSLVYTLARGSSESVSVRLEEKDEYLIDMPCAWGEIQRRGRREVQMAIETKAASSVVR